MQSPRSSVRSTPSSSQPPPQYIRPGDSVDGAPSHTTPIPPSWAQQPGWKPKGRGPMSAGSKHGLDEIDLRNTVYNTNIPYEEPATSASSKVSSTPSSRPSPTSSRAPTSTPSTAPRGIPTRSTTLPTPPPIPPPAPPAQPSEPEQSNLHRAYTHLKNLSSRPDMYTNPSFSGIYNSSIGVTLPSKPGSGAGAGAGVGNVRVVNVPRAPGAQPQSQGGGSIWEQKTEFERPMRMWDEPETVKGMWEQWLESQIDDVDDEIDQWTATLGRNVSAVRESHAQQDAAWGGAASALNDTLRSLSTYNPKHPVVQTVNKSLTDIMGSMNGLKNHMDQGRTATFEGLHRSHLERYKAAQRGRTYGDYLVDTSRGDVEFEEAEEIWQRRKEPAVRTDRFGRKEESPFDQFMSSRTQASRAESSVHPSIVASTLATLFSQNPLLHRKAQMDPAMMKRLYDDVAEDLEREQEGRAGGMDDFGSFPSMGNRFAQGPPSRASFFGGESKFGQQPSQPRASFAQPQQSPFSRFRSAPPPPARPPPGRAPRSPSYISQETSSILQNLLRSDPQLKAAALRDPEILTELASRIESRTSGGGGRQKTGPSQPTFSFPGGQFRQAPQRSQPSQQTFDTSFPSGRFAEPEELYFEPQSRPSSFGQFQPSQYGNRFQATSPETPPTTSGPQRSQSQSQISRASNMLKNMLRRNPQMQRTAESNPGILKTWLNELTSKLSGGQTSQPEEAYAEPSGYEGGFPGGRYESPRQSYTTSGGPSSRFGQPQQPQHTQSSFAGSSRATPSFSQGADPKYSEPPQNFGSFLNRPAQTPPPQPQKGFQSPFSSFGGSQPGAGPSRFWSQPQFPYSNPSFKDSTFTGNGASQQQYRPMGGQSFGGGGRMWGGKG